MEQDPKINPQFKIGSMSSIENNCFSQILEICPICLQYKTNPIILSNCKHSFCINCIYKWLKIKAYCPMCKTFISK